MREEPTTAEELHEYKEFKIANAKSAQCHQSFPGEHFNHLISFSGSNVVKEKDFLFPSHPSLSCPCGAVIYISIIFRHHGKVDIIECPKCDFWHTITWVLKEPIKDQGEFFPAFKP